LPTPSAEPASSIAIAERAGTSPENRTYNLRQLVGTMTLTKEQTSYRITDRVFSTWLARL